MIVSPTHDTQSQPIEPVNSSVSNQHKPFIKTPRDYRFILSLLGGEVSTHDLVATVGSANIWEHCRQLKKRGWLIITTTKPFKDRDGRVNPTGYYHLVVSQKPIALEVTQDYLKRQAKAMIKIPIKRNNGA